MTLVPAGSRDRLPCAGGSLLVPASSHGGVPCTAGPSTWFGSSASDGTSNFAANTVYFFDAIATASGNVTAGRISWASGAGGCKLAVYSSSASAPGTLLGQTAPFTPTVPGYTQADYLAPFAVVNGTHYFLAFVAPGASFTIDRVLSGAYYFQASANFPASAAASSSAGVTGKLQAGI